MKLLTLTTVLILTVTLCGTTLAKHHPLKRFLLQTTTTPPLTTTPPTCTTPGGQTLFPGQEVTEECRYCYCESHWGLTCYYFDCRSPMCVDAYRPPGACCWECPTGNNCRILSTGEVIPAGEPVERDGMLCECPPQDDFLPGRLVEENYIALCTRVTTMPPTTAPPTTIPSTVAN
ncbi:hypothetical protein BaRGS_00024831 [Batillaria attramentaria]|uniref:VWFC domain-containing protein n=1 Tax=Batillaria attramentaria TaxID=370345 RepID=A0ABD0KAB9_9CAEN